MKKVQSTYSNHEKSAINTKYWLGVLRLKHELKLIRQRIAESGLIMLDTPTWATWRWDGLILMGHQAHVVPPRVGLEGYLKSSHSISYPHLNPAFKDQFNKNRDLLGVLEVILKDWKKDYNELSSHLGYDWNIPSGLSLTDVQRQHYMLKNHHANLNFYFDKHSLRLYYWGDPTIVVTGGKST